MAINPPSDIVLDVARAADPARYQNAVEKLSKLHPEAETVAFSEVLSSVDRPAETQAVRFDRNSALADMRHSDAANDRAATDGVRKTYRDFESFFLQSLFQLMLPQDGSSIYGKGTAGEFWKSLFAENLGKELSNAGGIGVADQLLAGRLGQKAEAEGSARVWASNLPSLDPRFPGFLNDKADGV
ncbi:MAG: rod-binding protein [Parvibaculaceae bacterium]